MKRKYNYTIDFKNFPVKSYVVMVVGTHWNRLTGPSRAITIESDIKPGGRLFDSQSGHILLSLRFVHENMKRF